MRCVPVAIMAAVDAVHVTVFFFHFFHFFFLFTFNLINLSRFLQFLLHKRNMYPMISSIFVCVDETFFSIFKTKIGQPFI